MFIIAICLVICQTFPIMNEMTSKNTDPQPINFDALHPEIDPVLRTPVDSAAHDEAMATLLAGMLGRIVEVLPETVPPEVN